MQARSGEVEVGRTDRQAWNKTYEMEGGGGRRRNFRFTEIIM